MSTIRSISCTVSRVLFPREEFSDGARHFVVMLTSCGKAKGELAFYPAHGTRLNLTGRDEVYHGERVFHFSRAEQDVPTDEHALLVYVAELSKGVGPKAVEKIWSQYGADWRAHVDEMSPSVGLPISRTLASLMSNRRRLELTMFLIQHGGSPTIAEKAWHAWGDTAVSTIGGNPYLLSRIDGIGFKTADAIARTFGIGESDPRRSLAAVEFGLVDMMESSGDSVVSRDALYRKLRDDGVAGTSAQNALARLVQSGRIQFVDMDRVTTSHVVDTEGEIVRYVADASDKFDIEPVFPDGFTPDESQVTAVRNALVRSGMTIINGGAGAGKTTIIRAIADTLERNGMRFYLCAFAGKAAARLREATGHYASTIHSMLGWNGDGRGFTSPSLEGYTVIVDEASMVPSSLMYEIAKRSPRRLILVGDQAQLQPVGVGAPFHDFIECAPWMVNTLTTCYRNREAVFSNALRIREGRLPEDSESAHEKFSIVRVASPEQAHDRIVSLVRAGDIDFSQDIVLAPRNGEGEDPAACTVKSLNASMQSIVNPHADGEKFKVGDRVMCVKNFAQLDIWNGTTGSISRIDTDGRPYFAKDDGGEVLLSSKEHVGNIVPAYCLTVHKSQGSQYRDVYVCVLKRDGAVLMDRSMLYTAVTRAKRACYIVCDEGLDRVVNAMYRRSTYIKTLCEIQNNG